MPPDSVSRPNSRDAPESHDDPTVAHFGALRVESYTAVWPPVAEVTVSVIVVLWTIDPDVPVIVTVEVPVAAVPDAVNVRVEVAVPLAGGVTGLGENAAVTPLGSPVAVRVVAELKLFRLVTVMVLVAFVPCAMLTELGEAETVNPGAPAPTAKTRSS